MEKYEIILGLILGLFICLFGYRLKKIVFFVAWFLIGYMITQSLMPTIITGIPIIADSGLWQTLLPVACGLLLSLIGFMIEKMCVALLCLAATVMFAINQFGWDGQVIIIASIIGVVLAGFAVMLIKPATIIVTSAAGALAVTNSILAIATSLSSDTYHLPILLGVTAVSAIFQFVNTKGYM